MIKKINFKLILVLFLAGCVDLETEPTGSVPDDQAFLSENSVKAVLNGVYDGLQSGAIVQDYILHADLAADNLDAVGSKIEYREVNNNRITTFNVDIEGIWNAHYDVINRANQLIAGLQGNSGFSESFKQEQVGQARFIRSMAYFNLVRMFGPVPYRDQPAAGIAPEEVNQARIEQGQLYDLIIQDLNQAETELEGTGTGSSPYLVSEAAVKALLARVYLYNDQFEQAANKAQEVINLGYELVNGEDYQLLFDENESNNEVIFAIDYANDEARNTLASYTQPTGRFEVAATKELYDAFSNNDIRKGSIVRQSGNSFYINKYDDLVNLSDNSIVLRLAEMYLIRAEALNQLQYVPDGEAFQLLNQVRNRAGLDDIDAANAQNQASFNQYVLEERRRELVGEGHRWFDLIRNDQAIQMLSEKGTLRVDNGDNDNQLLFPIPQSEVDANRHPDMYQNQGY
ncbi:MAG: RagB/SusD family nutrient uptake outer membrane protein [Candidatus Cyclobacteriaceae bacterium M3_2C_046]